MKSTLQAFKNQLRPNLSNNNSSLKSTDSSSNIFNITVFTYALKLQNTSLNPINATQITFKQNKNTTKPSNTSFNNFYSLNKTIYLYKTFKTINNGRKCL